MPSSGVQTDRKSTRLNSSHTLISYAVFCLKKKKIPDDLTHVIVDPVHGEGVTHFAMGDVVKFVGEFGVTAEGDVTPDSRDVGAEELCVVRLIVGIGIAQV